MDAADLSALIVIGSLVLAVVFIACGFVFFGIDVYKAGKESRKVKTGYKVWLVISIALTVLLVLGFIALMIIAFLAMLSM